MAIYEPVIPSGKRIKQFSTEDPYALPVLAALKGKGMAGGVLCH